MEVFNGISFSPANSKIARNIHKTQKKSMQTYENQIGIGFDLFSTLRGYLKFGGVVGIIPIKGVWKSNKKSLQFRFLSFPALFTLTNILLLGFCTAMSLLRTIKYRKGDIMDMAESIQGTVFNAWGLYCYLHFFVKAKEFVSIFEKWGCTFLHNTMRDKTFKRDMLILSIVITLCSVGEFSLFHMDYFPQFDNATRNPLLNKIMFNSTLETFYMRAKGHWYSHLGYHPILALMALFSSVLLWVSWNYVDLILIILARAVYSKFKGLCKMAKIQLGKYNELLNYKEVDNLDQKIWDNFAKDHDTVCELLASVQNFVSPLIFGTYATNIYYICIRFAADISLLTKQQSIVRSMFVTFNFFNLIFRVLRLTIAGAKIHEYAHEIGHVIRKCPIDLYNDEVERLHKKVTTGPNIGFSGLGTFTVTKPFILNILSVVFTVELIFLTSNNPKKFCVNDTA